MSRILIDTNVFVAAAYNRQSASREVVAAVERGELTLVVSPAIVREYEAIIPQAVRAEEGRELFRRVLGLADQVTPAKNPPVTADREDDKFLAAALAGGADAIISNDRETAQMALSAAETGHPASRRCTRGTPRVRSAAWPTCSRKTPRPACARSWR
jgi:putative PIN family toxin of toxin-antitoxin system